MGDRKKVGPKRVKPKLDAEDIEARRREHERRVNLSRGGK